MDAISVALTIAVALTLCFIWLRDRSKGEHARHLYTYQQQNSHQTLHEGLDEFYAARGLLSPDALSADSEAGLRAHDAAHVVFGCDDSTRGEVVLARWSLFGARNALLQYIRGLRQSETRWLFADFVRKLRPTALVLGVLDGFQAFARSLRMTARWPSEDWERYLESSLAEIRGEFNIRVV